jgi:uncharacterized protein
MKEGMKMKKTLFVWAVVVGFIVTGMGRPASAEQVNLTWMSGTAGGGWYSMAAGIAAILKEADPEIMVKVLPGGGSQNPAALGEKKVDIAFGLPFLNQAAYEGKDPYEKKYDGLRIIACGNMSLTHLHLYAGGDTPYKTMDDIFGGQAKPRIAMSQRGASEIYVLERILEVYNTSIDGLSKKGYHIAQGNYSYQVSQFRDRNIDIVWSFLAAPAAQLTEASIGRDLRLIPFPEKVIKHLEKFGLISCEISAGTYPKALNGNQAVRVACNGTAILVHKDMSDALAYRLTKLFNDNIEKVYNVHPSFRTYFPKDGLLGAGSVPPHSGALKYYKEKGWAR